MPDNYKMNRLTISRHYSIGLIPIPNTFSVYVLTSPKGKIYVGSTHSLPHRRWKNGKGYPSNPPLQADIDCYGWESFTHKIIAVGLTKDNAHLLEAKLIIEYQSIYSEYGYNIADKGAYNVKGCKPSQEVIDRRKAGHRGIMKGCLWCNNGIVERRYVGVLDGMPNGFTPGRINRRMVKPCQA